MLRATAGAVAVGGLAGVGAAEEPDEYNIGIKPGAKARDTAAAERAANSVRKTIDFGDIGLSSNDTGRRNC